MKTPALEPSRLLPILKRVTLGMVITLLLLAGTNFVETTTVGRWLEARTYEFLHSLLTANASNERLPILVIDISKIPGGKDAVTLRQPLREIIKTIADERPKAIGIDVDFSPNGKGWKDDDDPQFFDFCLSIKRDTGVPIFLAVYDTWAEPAKGWLGLERYSELAAAGVAVPKYDKRRLIRWIQAKDVRDKLPTLGTALAASYRPSLPGPPNWLTRTLEVTADNEHGIERWSDDQTRFGLALINYSKLQEIQNETLSTISAKSIAEADERFSGRMVLLGDATHFGDPHNVPGHDEPVAGVHVVGCAAYTLAVEPLFELNSRARITLDLLIAVGIILFLEVIRVLYVKKRPGIRFFKAQGRSIVGVMVLVFFLGVVMIWRWHIMWFDFPLVIFASLLHPRVEDWFGSFWKKVRAQKASVK